MSLYSLLTIACSLSLACGNLMRRLMSGEQMEFKEHENTDLLEMERDFEFEHDTEYEEPVPVDFDNDEDYFDYLASAAGGPYGFNTCFKEDGAECIPIIGNTVQGCQCRSGCCENNRCVAKKRDWTEIFFYCPAECVGQIFGRPGTC